MKAFLDRLWEIARYTYYVYKVGEFDLIENYPCEQENDIEAALADNNFEALSALFSSLNPFEQTLFLDCLSSKGSTEFFDQIHNDYLHDVTAQLFYADYYMLLFGQYRGGSTWSQISEENLERMKIAADIAHAALQRILTLDPANPHATMNLVTLMMNYGGDKEEINELVNAALQKTPNHFQLINRGFNATLEKWGGSHESSLAFVNSFRPQFEQVPETTSLVAKYHIEQWLYKRYFEEHDDPEKAAADYMSQADVIEDLKAAHKVFVTHRRGDLSHHSCANQFAFAFYLSNQKAELKDCLTCLGYNIPQSPWRYIGDDFDEAIYKAFIKAGVKGRPI